MTRRRMLAIVTSKSLTKFIEASELPRSFKRQRDVDQHFKRSMKQKETQSTIGAFQAKKLETHNPQQLVTYISNLLLLESKYNIDSSFLFYVNPVVEDKVNSDLRDYTVKGVQIMNKVFFELPIDVFVKATALVDRFITIVKVKPKYMSCVATACFYIAAKFADQIRVDCPSLETLSQLSKCGGSVQDLERMVDIIMSKLDHNLEFVTSHDFLEFFYKVRCSERLSSWLKLRSLLEVAQTSLRICYQRPSAVALACLVVNQAGNDLTFVKAMSTACKVDLKVVMATAEILSQLYRECYCRRPSSRNSLVWAISKRTLSKIYGSSPTSLATISEEVYSCSKERICEDKWSNDEDWSSSLVNLFAFDSPLAVPT